MKQTLFCLAGVVSCLVLTTLSTHSGYEINTFLRRQFVQFYF